MISVIIPSLIVGDQLLSTVRGLYATQSKAIPFEIIVAYYGSIDADAQTELDVLGVMCICCPVKGRAKQMNTGAAHATGDILYFLHADTLAPKGRNKLIVDAVSQGHGAGSFVLQFDYNHWFLKSQARRTKRNVRWLRFGDQSLFVTKQLWCEVGGFDEHMIIEEDNDIARKLYSKTKRYIVPFAVTTSAEKYLHYGIYKTQIIFYLIHILYLCGVSQAILMRIYRFFKNHV